MCKFFNGKFWRYWKIVECFEFVGNNLILYFLIKGLIIGFVVISVFLFVKVIFLFVLIVVIVGNKLV